MERNLTTGSVLKNLMFFSLPYLLSYFLQTLYGMADLFIVGQFDGVASTTAVSVGSQVMHMLTVMIVGLAMGATVMIGRCIGAKDYRKASETIGTLTDFWNLEENVKARESIWRELKFLWKHSRPRKADLTLHFGFEDPSWTGQCMGVLSILNVWYPGRIFLKPEFEQEIFEGTLYIKGHMMLAVPLLSIFRLWRDENVMKMYRRFRQ